MNVERQLPKRVLSVFLALLMIFTLLPINVISVNAAENEKAHIKVGTAVAMPGETVELNVVLENAPIIKSMSISNIAYDTTKMTLSNVEWLCDAEIRNWNPSQGRGVLTFGENTDANGPILKMSFVINKVVEDADVSVNCNMAIRRMNDVDDEIVVASEIIPGNVTINNAIRGDMDNNGKLNSNDAVYLLYHVMFGKDDYPIRQSGDIDGNDKVNSNDAVYLLYNIMFGEDEYPIHLPCAHSMQHFDAKEATCIGEGNIEYWYCALCNSYFMDKDGKEKCSYDSTVIPATGHTVVLDPEVPATYDHTGLTEGSHCSECGTVLKAQNVIPVLKKNEYSITYHIANNDSYLQQKNIVIPEDKCKYTSEDGLSDLPIVDEKGYNFKGWYDGTASNANKITCIEKGSIGNKDLYAQFEKTTYTITFNSPLAPKESIKRTIDEYVPIPDNNSITAYKFMGWTDSLGNVVTEVKPGTEDITLYANWISYRNQTVSNDYLSKGPIIINDEEKKQYLFVYDIGKIINVPLYTIKDFANTTSGITVTESDSKTDSISKSTAKTITESIVNSTTNSASWTLSKDWNRLVTNTHDFSKTELEENKIAISDGYTHSSGTTTDTGTVQDTGTVTDTGTITKDNTTTKDTKSTKKGGSISSEVGTNNVSPIKASIKAEVHKDVTQGSESGSEHGTTENDLTKTNNLTKTNDLTSTTNSSTASHDKTITDTISKSISENWGYSISDSVGGSDSSTEEYSDTESKSNTYSTTFSYTTQQTTTNVKEYSTASAEPGWHRLVCAGTVHVFAVVGFDIATGTYYYYTYSALDDERHEFYDYSKISGEYNDYESGVLPFEVPIDVHHYVSNRIASTEGLIIDDTTGIVVGYEGDSKFVNIPDYLSIDNKDGTFRTVKITGITSNAFSGNKNITAVRLSNYITEIPDDAFVGCSSLVGIDYNKITSIGNNAFSGCTSFKKFIVTNDVVRLGDNAFENVIEVEVNAINKNAAVAGVSCGAKKLTVNMSLTADEIKDTKLETSSTTETFVINGYRKSYDNLEIKSESNSITLNGITFNSNTGIPLTLTSEEVTLIDVNVIDAKSMIMLLQSDITNILVEGTNTFITQADNVGLVKNITINRTQGLSRKSVLEIPNGKLYICGSELTETDKKYLDIPDSQIEYITAEQYATMLDTHKVIFNANEGTVSENIKTVTYGSALGTLPTPTRDYYTFDGWFTAADGGEKVTADTVFTSTEDVTYYAHWTINPTTTDWVKASEMPEGAVAVNTKYSYTQRSYTTSGSSSMSGWTKYDTKRTSWGGTHGPVYSDPNNGSRNVWSEQYVASQTTHYVYYHRYKSSAWSDDAHASSWARHSGPDVTSPLPNGYYSSTTGQRYSGAACGSCGATNQWHLDYTYTTDNYATRWYYQEPVYTYYFYKDENKETTTDPTGQSNVSNVQEWVQYRVK